MSSYARLAPRLQQGRPLVLDSDTSASLRRSGASLDTAGAFGQLLRQRPSAVIEHYAAELAAGVDILTALTSDTTPRSLAEVGMEHRAAALTRRAVELGRDALEQAARPCALAGVLGSDMVSSVFAERLVDELREHAERLATADCDLLLVRGHGARRTLDAAVEAARRTGLPTWVALTLDRDGSLDGAPLERLVGELGDQGVSAVVLDLHDAELGARWLGETAPRTEVALGAVLAAAPEAVRGFEHDATSTSWLEHLQRLEAAGARVLGGGAGTTEAHSRALRSRLSAQHSVPPPAQP